MAFTSAPVPAPVIGTPTGQVSVNKGNGKACGGTNNTTIKFSVTNATSTATVTVKYSSNPAANASFTGTYDAGGAPVFSYKWAAGSQLSLTAFPVTITATSGSGTGTSTPTISVNQVNNGQC